MKKLPFYAGAAVLLAGICLLAYLYWARPVDALEAERVEVTFFDQYAQNNHNGFTFEQFGHLELYANQEGRFVIPYFLSYGRENMDKLMERCDGETLFYVDLLPDSGAICRLADEDGNVYITPEQYNALKCRHARIKTGILAIILLIIMCSFLRHPIERMVQSLKRFAQAGCAIVVITIVGGGLLSAIFGMIPSDNGPLEEFSVTFEDCFIEDRRNGYSDENEMLLRSPQEDSPFIIHEFRQYGDIAYRLKELCDKNTVFRVSAYYYAAGRNNSMNSSGYRIVRLEDENGTVYLDDTETYRGEKLSYWEKVRNEYKFWVPCVFVIQICIAVYYFLCRKYFDMK